MNSDYFNEGYQAYLNSESLEENPYQIPLSALNIFKMRVEDNIYEYSEWERGWKFGEFENFSPDS